MNQLTKVNILKIKRQLAAFLALWLPPIVSQRVRSVIYSERDGISEAAIFIKKSITGSFFTGNTQDMHAYVFSVHGFYTWRNVAIAKAICSNGGEIIEVGANIGTETVCFSDIVNQAGCVFAFEPFGENYNWLRKNAEKVKYSNLHTFPYAISDKTELVEFIPPPNNHSTGIGNISPKEANSQSDHLVQCFQLDDFISEFSAVKCIFIDIEGADLLAVRGAKKITNKFRPSIILEVTPKLMKKYKLTITDFENEMAALNYKIFLVGRLSLKKVSVKKGYNGNFICIPFEKLEIKNRIDKTIFKSAVLPSLFSRFI